MQQFFRNYILTMNNSKKQLVQSKIKFSNI